MDERLTGPVGRHMETDTWKDRQTERHTERQTDGETDEWVDGFHTDGLLVI